jgi:DNA integrity scanning protein DisA with diadenylate cyclase activity
VDLVITSWVLDGAAIIAIVLLVVVFQSELRRGMMRLERILRVGSRPAALAAHPHGAIGQAAFSLAKARVGALVVIVRRDSIAELISGGLALGAETSAELLEAIFQKTSPLHDGAAIVEGERVTLANAVLPLTQREDVPSAYGTRHRAAMGLAERCDALVTAVSEERGEVTLLEGRRIRPMQNARELVRALEELQTRARASWGDRMRQAFLSNLGFKAAALGLAGLIWGMSFVVAGTTVRTVSVPVEFSDVPPGMEITEQSAPWLEVQLRGNTWLMDSVGLSKMVARLSLRDAREGIHILSISPDALDLPPGIVMERVTPRRLSVHLARRAQR